jgi:hypothetical protein
VPAGTTLAVPLVPGTAPAQKANALVVDGSDRMSAPATQRRSFLAGVAWQDIVKPTR